MAMTGPASHHDGVGIDSETQLTASQKTFGASGAIVSDSFKLIFTDKLDGAEIYEETDEREDGSGSSQAQTQTTETQVVLDSKAQAHFRLGRVGREAHPDRCLYYSRNCAGSFGSDVS